MQKTTMFYIDRFCVEPSAIIYCIRINNVTMDLWVTTENYRAEHNKYYLAASLVTIENVDIQFLKLKLNPCTTNPGVFIQVYPTGLLFT